MDRNTEELVYSEISTVFQPDVVKEVFKSKFSNPKNRVTEDSLELICEISKALAMEAALRSGKIAIKEKNSVVTLEHVESILPQLMLDFP
ncbi:hypothetical protein HHI36_000597 [Cryptolaemus montrouzieri]|uniref:Centromere protein X n=1 Tax=Cryptolaemus montrouzieri TaxID=559131 RepID=A0ABD2P4Z0_9CUCU